MGTADDFVKALLEGADPEKLSAFVRELKKDKPAPKVSKTVEHGPVKTYTTVRKDYVCLSCDHQFHVTYQMEKGETISTINEDGSCQNMTISGNQETISLKCTCSVCLNCKTAASGWSREELERRWFALVQSTGFHEKRMCKAILARPMSEFRL
jgi:transcriptional antiterminator Rof (Rho-off)